MSLRTLLVVSLLASSGLVWAQTGPPFVGTWKVSWQGEKRLQEARLVISENGGTWKTATSSKLNACVGHEVPIALEPVSAQELKVRLKFSEVLQGCSDALVTLRSGDGQNLTGMRGAAELTLERQ